MASVKDTRQKEREARWERIETLKTDLLARVTARPEAERDTPPATGEWSPLQVVAHLLKTETLMNDGIPTGDAAIHSAARRVPGPVFALLCNVLRAAIPLPAPEQIQPGSPPPLDTIAADWAAERERLRRHLDANETASVFAVHPLFGALTADQVLQATEAHLTYHLKRFPGTRR